MSNDHITIEKVERLILESTGITTLGIAYVFRRDRGAVATYEVIGVITPMLNSLAAAGRIRFRPNDKGHKDYGHGSWCGPRRKWGLTKPRILARLARGPATRAQLRVATGASTSSVDTWLRRLAAEGVARSNGGRWEVVR